VQNIVIMKILIKEERLFDLAYNFISLRVGNFQLNYSKPDWGYYQWNSEIGDFFADYNYDNKEYGINENLYELVDSFFSNKNLNVDHVWKKWLEDNLKYPAEDVSPVEADADLL